MPSYVYKITNSVNGMWYIGSHNGNNPNYMGSGLLLEKAKRKYGKAAFKKEILYEGDNYRAEEEKILTDLNASSDPNSYNLKNEALGGSFPGELNGMFGKTLTAEQKYRCGNAFRGKKRPDHSEALKGSLNPMFGKTYQTYGILERAKANSGKSLEEIFGDRAIEIRAKLSVSHKGKKHTLKEIQCPKCSKIGRGPNMSRYHFNNCKVK